MLHRTHRPLLLLGVTALGLTATSTPGAAQDELLEGHSGHGEVFNEGPRQAAYLMGGTGAVHFPVTVAGLELQELFDQGVGQLHGFWYFEAERTFRQIAAGDPDCAMAYWGMALANVENPERARGFARVAWLKRGLAGERERMYIDAVARYYQAEGPEEPEETAADETAEEDGAAGEAEAGEEAPEPFLTVAEREAAEGREREERKQEQERARRLVEDLEEIVWEYPDDIEAKALLVNQLWMNGGISSRQANEALIQQILAVEPMHPAHHYRIHLWDQDENAAHVVESAVKSGPSAPSIAHMWHMGGHIFEDLGRHADAAWQQEASARVDHAHMMRDWVLPDQIHNFAHNNEWLTRSLRHQGRVREAVDLAKNMIELPRHPIYNTLDQRGCSASWGRIRLLETLELFEQWEPLVELASTMYLEPSEQATDGALRAFSLGKAQAYLADAGGDEAGFERQVAALEDMLARSKRERAEDLDEAEERALAQGFEDEDLRAVQEDVLDEYERELDDVRDKLESLRALRAVLAGGEDVRAQLEMLSESRFDRSQLARLYLRAASASAGEDEEERDELRERAVELAREGIEKHKGQLYPYATLAYVLHEAGLEDEALEVFEELRPWAARADLDLPALKRLEPLAQALGLPADWRPEFAFPADVGERIDLTTLGPLRWSPPLAPDWVLEDAFGEEVALADYAGEPVIVIFFLGFGCVHCVEQLVAFAPAYDEFAAAGIEIVAIGTDSVEELRASFGDDPDDTGYPFRVLADPELEHFRRYRAHDDFEQQPLHGTFLVDGRGRMRWQDVSYEPFMEWEFLLDESRRLLGLDPGPTAGEPAPEGDDHAGLGPLERTRAGSR